jgi:CRISPR/Cas system CMR subunit Cmr4 (Cas7 group RAMP superfamily)
VTSLTAGERWLRLEVVTPANLGSAAGEVTLDRPTQKESWYGLPYLPDSALKGVLAAPYGDVTRPGGNREREAVFGAPDRGATRGHAGPVVIGNGEILAFPVPCRDGRVAWAFPAGSTARAVSMGAAPAAGPSSRVLDLLWNLDQDAAAGHAAAWPTMPELALPFSLDAWTGGPATGALHDAVAHLCRLAGPGVPASGPLLIMGSRTAAAVWRCAAERRVLTALDAGQRTVARGSLRAVELIPAGTVFLSLVSVLVPATALPAPGRLAVGAWESLGLGWVRPEMVEPMAERIATAAPTAQRPGPVGTGAGAGETPGARTKAGSAVAAQNEAEIMMAMHQAVAALREGGDRDLQGVARSAVAAFGPRAHFSGLAAALAFELAKAKPMQARPKTEARAHRWLLTALLTPEPDPVQAPGPCRPLLAWLGHAPAFSAERLAEQRDLVLVRWRWLRRYGELGLAGPAGDEGP